MNIFTIFVLCISLISILLIFIYHLNKLWKLYITENKDIDTLANLVKKIDLDTVSTAHHSISEELEEKHPNSHVMSVWREFEESLVIRDDHIENTLDADHFFNENSLCPSVFTRDLFKGIPNILVGLGVVFTFVGLVIGLFNLDIGSDNIEALKEGIGSIVNGAKISFISSIFGILLSIGFSYKHLHFKTALREKIQKLQNAIDFKYPRTNPEKSLAEMREYARETENHLGALSETLGDKLQEVVRGMGQEIRAGVESSLSATIGPYMEQIADKAMNSSENAFEKIVDEFLEKVGKAGEAQQKMILEANKSIQESLIAFRQEFTGEVIGLKEVVENLNRSYHFLENELVDKFDQVIQKLSVAIQEYAKTQTLLDVQTTKQNDILTNIEGSSAALNEMSTGIKTLIDKFRSQFEESVRAFNATTRNLETVYDANTAASHQMKTAAENMKEPFDLLQLEYEKTRKELENSVQKIAENMNGVLNSYFTQVQQQTTERMTEWNHQTTGFSSAMLDVTNELNTLVGKIQKNVKLVN